MVKHSLIASCISLTVFASGMAFSEVPANSPEPQDTAKTVDAPAPSVLTPPKIAFILPPKGSKFDAVTQFALDGLLAANYASEKPVEVLLIRPGVQGTVEEQLVKAAEAGASVAVGPLARQDVESISELPYLPLPVVTLNQVELNKEIPLSQEEIAQRAIEALARDMSDQAQRELNDNEEAANEKSAKTSEVEATISTATKVPGLVYADAMPFPSVKYEPKVFPRGLLMMGLSMQEDAAYVARLGVKALPRLTDAGKRPRVLILDQNTPLQKRVSQAFQQELTAAGFPPDRLTVNLDELQRISQFFDLVVEKDDPEIDPEELIDQEVDPLGWRQQQMRLRKLEAEKRAQATFAEPPYYAVFMALDAKTASQIRPRLPIRTRVWGTPALYPGNPATSSTAKAITYDLKQVAFVESPFILNFNAEEFEKNYRVAVPASLLQKRLFALGADALSVALSVANGESAKSIQGLTGTLSYDTERSPSIQREGATALILNGTIQLMTPEEIIAYEVVSSNAQPLATTQNANKKR